MPLFQFLGAALGAGVVISFISIAWPRISADPRPELLTKVRETVVETSPGRSLAEVLGVTDETGVSPVSVSSLITTGTNAAVDMVTRSTQKAVTGKILETLGTQFETLSEEDKASFRAKICVPAE